MAFFRPLATGVSVYRWSEWVQEFFLGHLGLSGQHSVVSFQRSVVWEDGCTLGKTPDPLRTSPTP
jgi:hypothetical protein